MPAAALYVCGQSKFVTRFIKVDNIILSFFSVIQGALFFISLCNNIIMNNIYMHVCIFRHHFFIEVYLIKYYKHLLPTYFYFDLFTSLYICYDIQLELANEFSIFNWFASTFRSLLDHHQGLCILQKYNITFYTGITFF